MTELTGSGGWKHSNVFAGGRLLASYEGPDGTAAAGYHFHLTDWLGTERMQTNAAGNNEETCTRYPFGDGLNCTGTSADATEHHFTGKERDTESGLDYFFARYYTSDLARFMTPDWAAAPTAVPYATFGDPQTLNLYAYVNNNPNTGIDFGGHFGQGDPTNLGSMLAGMELEGISFDGSDLRGSDLSGSDLYGANLADAVFDSCNLENADLRCTFLHHVSFRNANLRNARFSRDQLGGRQWLHEVDFTGADLDGTEFEGAVYDERTIFPPAFDPQQRGLTPSAQLQAKSE